MGAADIEHTRVRGKEICGSLEDLAKSFRPQRLECRFTINLVYALDLINLHGKGAGVETTPETFVRVGYRVRLHWRFADHADHKVQRFSSNILMFITNLALVRCVYQVVTITIMASAQVDQRQGLPKDNGWPEPNGLASGCLSASDRDSAESSAELSRLAAQKHRKGR